MKAQDKQEYLARVSQKLSNWQTRFDELKTRADKVEDRLEIEFVRQIDLLSAKLDLGQELLDKLKAADEKQWQELKVKMDGISNEIDNAIDSAWSKLSDS